MIDDTNTEAAKEEVPAELEAEAPAAQLSIQDLVNLRSIIDVASQRGAFKANEFSIVGATYTKLSNFIEGATAAAAPAEGYPAEPVGE